MYIFNSHDLLVDVIFYEEENSGQVVEELDENLRTLDKLDPVKYDFALFGLGIFENF